MSATQGKTRYTLLGPPGLSGIVFLGLFFMVLFGQQLGNMFNVLFDSDSCWLIKTGVWIIQHQALPGHNPFAGAIPELAQIPIVCYQWLFEVLLGFFYLGFDLPGVALFVAACFALTYAIMTLWLYDRGFKAVPDIIFSVLFSILTLKSYAVARPALMTLLFTAVLLRLYSGSLTEKQRWLILPALFLVWANMHLGFTAGLLVLGAFAIEDAWRQKTWKPLTLWQVCGLITLLNPYGYQLYTYFAQLADSPFMNHNIFELGSPAFNAQPLLLGYFLVVLACAFYTFRESRLRPAEKALFFISVGLALYSMRHIFLLALVSVPIMAAAISKFRQEIHLPLPGLSLFRFEGFTAENEKPWPWIIALLLVGVFVAHHRLNPLSFHYEAKLQGVIRHLNQHKPSGPMLSNEIWGSYLLYFTNQRSYLDTRMDMYGDAWVQKFYKTLNLERGWQKTFQQYRIRQVLLPARSLQASYLSDYCRGTILYQDSYAVLIRTDSLAKPCQPIHR